MIYFLIIFYILGGILNVKNMRLIIDVYENTSLEDSYKKKDLLNLVKSSSAKFVYFFFWPYMALQPYSSIFDRTTSDTTSDRIDSNGEVTRVTESSVMR